MATVLLQQQHGYVECSNVMAMSDFAALYRYIAFDHRRCCQYCMSIVYDDVLLITLLVNANREQP